MVVNNTVRMLCVCEQNGKRFLSFTVNYKFELSDYAKKNGLAEPPPPSYVSSARAHVERGSVVGGFFSKVSALVIAQLAHLSGGLLQVGNACNDYLTVNANTLVLSLNL